MHQNKLGKIVLLTRKTIGENRKGNYGWVQLNSIILQPLEKLATPTFQTAKYLFKITTSNIC